LQIPQLARSADFPLPRTSQANPLLGWNIWFWLCNVPSEGKLESLKFGPYAVCNGAMVMDGKCCASQRRPRFTVRLRVTFHVSCANRANSSLLIEEAPD